MYTLTVLETRKSETSQGVGAFRFLPSAPRKDLLRVCRQAFCGLLTVCSVPLKRSNNLWSLSPTPSACLLSLHVGRTNWPSSVSALECPIHRGAEGPGESEAGVRRGVGMRVGHESG